MHFFVETNYATYNFQIVKITILSYFLFYLPFMKKLQNFYSAKNLRLNRRKSLVESWHLLRMRTVRGQSMSKENSRGGRSELFIEFRNDILVQSP
jgi:hypothetical protein